eukprot:TRINITY_DN7353_c0_g1_i1.p1 TRINITY_DN7353_c0_g1~~TRINITY_DN7353_c0_g1_i1.p1  ORF type:complete len:468 (+),score=118.55 TRINITY_DN7353_c0_g1_i1:72-1406(+)
MDIDDNSNESKRLCSPAQQPDGQWLELHHVIMRHGPFAAGHFEPGQDVAQLLREAPVLIIGAGGLGCELLKNLALSGFGDIHIIDMDTIDVSNLNRQFLFRPRDIGQSKAVVAANFVMARVPGVRVTPHHCAIQAKDSSFYRGFAIVVCGLDSLEARRWINAQLVSLLQYDDDGAPEQATVIPLVDGGTEGFRGQVKVNIPGSTSCLECIVDAFTPPVTFPLCTIASTPRQPEHCIEYAALLKWQQDFPDRTLDPDDPDDIDWVLREASAYAEKHHIAGVNRVLAQGVVKHIIPAIASTNAIIAAATANEAFKLATGAAGLLENFMAYHGGDGAYTYTFSYEKRTECLVCGKVDKPFSFEMSSNATVQDLVDEIGLHAQLQLKKPTISTTDGRTVYATQPPGLQRATAAHLTRPLQEFAMHGAVLSIADPALHTHAAAILITYN